MNVLNNNNKRPVGIALVVTLVLLAALVFGCSVKTDAPAETKKAAATKSKVENPEGKEEVDVLSNREFTMLVEALSLQAKSEIQPQHTKPLVEHLRQKIEADIAAEKAPKK